MIFWNDKILMLNNTTQYIETSKNLPPMLLLLNCTWLRFIIINTAVRIIKIESFRKKNFKSWWSCTIISVSLHPLLCYTISRRIDDIGCIQNDIAHWALNKFFLSSNWYIPLDLKIWSSVSSCCFECIHWLRSMMRCRGYYYSHIGMFVHVSLIRWCESSE